MGVQIKIRVDLDDNDLQHAYNTLAQHMQKSGLAWETEGWIDAEGDEGDETDLKAAIIEHMTGEPQTICKFCNGVVPLNTAHKYDGRYVGDDCCWDERLRATD